MQECDSTRTELRNRHHQPPPPPMNHGQQTSLVSGVVSRWRLQDRARPSLEHGAVGSITPGSVGCLNLPVHFQCFPELLP